MPVSIKFLSESPEKARLAIAKVVAEVNHNLIFKYSIRPKAEHNSGIFFPWLNHDNLTQFNKCISEGEYFLHPAFYLYNKLLESEKSILTHDPSILAQQHEKRLERFYFWYLSGKTS